MTDQPIPTTERLARALEAASAPQAMIARARAGYYDDFKSEEATPIVRLVEHANTNELYDIAQRAIDGEFDATKEEGDEWMSSPEGQEVLQYFMPGTTYESHRTKPKNPFFNRKKRRHRG